MSEIDKYRSGFKIIKQSPTQIIIKLENIAPVLNNTQIAAEDWEIKLNTNSPNISLSRTAKSLASQNYEIFGELFFNYSASLLRDNRSGTFVHAGHAAATYDGIEYPDFEEYPSTNHKGWYLFYSSTPIIGFINKGGYYNSNNTLVPYTNRNFMVFSNDSLKSTLNSGRRRFEETNQFGAGLSFFGSDPTNRIDVGANIGFNNLSSKPWSATTMATGTIYSATLHIKPGNFDESFLSSYTRSDFVKKTFSSFDPKVENYLFISGVLGNRRDIGASGEYLWRASVTWGRYYGSWRKGIEPGLLIAESDPTILATVKNVLRAQVAYTNPEEDGRIWKAFFSHDENLAKDTSESLKRFQHIHPMPTFIERLLFYVEKSGQTSILNEVVPVKVIINGAYVTRPGRTYLQAAELAAQWLVDNMITPNADSSLPLIPENFDTYPDLCIGAGNHTYTTVLIYNAFSSLAKLEDLAGKTQQASFYRDLAANIKEDVNNNYVPDDFSSGLWKEYSDGSGALIGWRAENSHVCGEDQNGPIYAATYENPETFANTSAILVGLIDDPVKISKIFKYFDNRSDFFYNFVRSDDIDCLWPAPEYVPADVSVLGPVPQSEARIPYYYCPLAETTPGVPSTYGAIYYSDPWYGLVDIQARLASNQPNARTIYDKVMKSYFYGPLGSQPIRYPFYETHSYPASAMHYYAAGRIWESSLWFDLIYSTHFGLKNRVDGIEINPKPIKSLDGAFVKYVKWKNSEFNVSFQETEGVLSAVTLSHQNGSDNIPSKIIFPSGGSREVVLHPGETLSIEAPSGEVCEANVYPPNEPDDTVNLNDFIQILSRFPQTGVLSEDLNSDQKINIYDIVRVIPEWLKICF